MSPLFSRLLSQLTLALITLCVVVGPSCQGWLGQLAQVVQSSELEEGGESTPQTDPSSPEPGDAELDSDEVPDALPLESTVLKLSLGDETLTASETSLLRPWRNPLQEINRPPRVQRVG